MKKALAMALGGLMVAGSAAPAMAASYIDFSGYYSAYNMSDSNLGRRGVDGETFTDNYWGHQLQVDLTFTPTDEISVFWSMRAPDFARWGGSAGIADDEHVFESRYFYGQIKQDWGTVTIGRLDDALDTYGLASLGYQPGSAWTNIGPYDTASRIDAVRYSNEWDNGFGFLAQYALLESQVTGLGELSVNNGALLTIPGVGTDRVDAKGVTGSDINYDRYQIEGTYKWDGGGAGLGVIYDRNAATGGLGFAGEGAADGGGTDFFWGGNNSTDWYLNPTIMHSFGNFGIHFEGMFGWGEQTRTLTAERKEDKFRNSRDNEGASFYLDMDYNYGPGNVTLAGWWASGTDLDEGYKKDAEGNTVPHQSGKSNSLVAINQGNFYPLLVAYNGTSAGYGRVYDYDGSDSGNAVPMANNAFRNYVSQAYRGNTDENGPMRYLNDPDSTTEGIAGFLGGAANSRVRTMSFNQGTGANHWAMTLSGTHAFTDDISMFYAVGYLALNEPNYTIATGATAITANTFDNYKYETQSKDLGYEIDLGFTFQLLDNLEFNTSFGYMFNGDAYKTLEGFNIHRAGAATDEGDTVKAVWADPDDTYVWYNTLTFSF